MMQQLFLRHARVSGALGLMLALSAGSAFAQGSAMVRVRGTIERVDGPMLAVKSRDGASVSIKLADNVAVVAVKKASLDDIKPGVFIGTAAMPQAGGGRRALEVLIFPESMRGAGEGDRPWDLLPESTMTNATVAETVAGVDGRTMRLTYKGGEQTISIPPDAPIVTFMPAEKADAAPGVPVFLTAEKLPDGSLRAQRITVGKNGVAPPM